LEAQLGQDGFERVGKVTTLSEFGAYLEADWDGRGEAETCIVTMLLCGESERAAQYLEQLKERRERASESDYLWMLERKASGGASDSYDLVMRELEKATRRRGPVLSGDARASRQLLPRRRGVLRAASRRRSKRVKELKIEDIWEPSPFPIELPAAERRQSDEALFSTTPWIAERPSPLMDLPAVPGEVRFAIDFGRRNGLTLIAPLTRQEAEERHRRFEKYVLAVRLGSGLDFVGFQRGGASFAWTQPPMVASKRRSTRLSVRSAAAVIQAFGLALQSGPLHRRNLRFGVPATANGLQTASSSLRGST
jgi:hypothetical protein